MLYRFCVFFYRDVQSRRFQSGRTKNTANWPKVETARTDRTRKKKKKKLTPKVDDFHQGPAQKSETAFFFTKGQHNNPETALFVQTARDFENR